MAVLRRLPLLLALAAAGRGLALDVCDGAEGSAGEGVCDEVSMLQRARASRSWPPAPAEPPEPAEPAQPASPEAGGPRRAVTFEGGGFLALADFTALVEALLVQLRGAGRASTMHGLFRDVHIFVGVSGGGWLQSLLMYSRSYVAMLETALISPHMAGPMFKMFIGNIFNPFKGGGSISAGLLKCLEKIGPLLADPETAAAVTEEAEALEAAVEATQGAAGTAAPALVQLQRRLEARLRSRGTGWTSQVVAELLILLRSGSLTWTNAVKQFLSRGGGINGDIELGSHQANRWAHGKIGLWTAGVITPASKESLESNLTQIPVLQDKRGIVAYRCGSGIQPVDMWTPAAFAAVVGGGRDRASPVPFCPGCAGYRIQYTLNNESVGNETVVSDTFRSAFEEQAGRLSLLGVTSAGSAFEAWIGVSNGMASSQGCAELSVWTTSAREGRSFQAAERLRTGLFERLGLGRPLPELAASIAREGLLPIMDGGWLEMTGVPQAVLAGADEVVAFLATDLTGESVEDRNATFTLNLKFLFPGCDWPDAVIFASPTAAEVMEQYRDLERIPAVEGSKFLTNVAFGSISAVTADNAFFGITAGRPVTLRVIALETQQLSIGLVQDGYSFNDFMQYADLVGEIVTTLSSSERSRELLPFFGP